jgi:Flp pilus assembly protein TadG
MSTSRFRNDRGQALIEVALSLPLLLMISVGMFEFGRAYQTWQVLTNAAREGARLAVLPGMADDVVKTRVKAYMTSGVLDADQIEATTVDVTHNEPIALGAGTALGSKVTVQFPFEFMVMKPVAQLLVSDSTAGDSFTMAASAMMRNE